MSETDYSNLMRKIVRDYLEHRTTRVEYLAKRRELLDQIDFECNGDQYSHGWTASSSVHPSSECDPSDITLVPKS